MFLTFSSLLQPSPQYIPIPPVTVPCNNHCCSREFLPMVLCWATTIHKLQGITIGPTEPGKPPNAIETLIVNIGSEKFEKNTPGLAYVALSCGNTMGKGDIMKSAVYISGDFTRDQITGMTYCRGQKRKTVVSLRCQHFIDYLECHKCCFKLGDKQTKALMRWATSHRVNQEDFMERVLFAKCIGGQYQ